MPQLRFDYTTADWVVFAPLRQLRPHSRNATESPPPATASVSTARCPFCPGNEAMTPRDIDAVRTGPAADSPWKVRVVPNKFPALQIEEEVRRVKDGALFERMGGCGAHEVIIEGREHDLFLANQPAEQVESLLHMLHRRYVDLMRDRRFQSVIVFKNHGERAGTSLHHPHWQVIATPVVPRLARLKLHEAASYYDRTGECLYEVLLNEELQSGQRVIAINGEFVAFLPYAGHLPFETWIVPRRSQSSFGMLQPDQLRPLANLLRFVLMKHDVALENPDFNLTIDTASRGDEDRPFFRWHVRILPRLATSAGFELGSGMAINTVLPEDAAEFLKAGNGITALEE